jgi:trk system potassium uptake protein TrkA
VRIITVGDGKVGLAITAQLSREGHDLLVIDSNENVLKDSVAAYDVQVIQGNGASLPILREAGAGTADLLIAATSGDELNMLTCILAKRLGAKHTIARVRNPEYSEQLVMLREELGLSMAVNPELAAAREAYNILQFPSFISRDSFAKGRVVIVELKIAKGSKLCELPLRRLYTVVDAAVLVCAVERKGQAFIPNGDFILRENDTIYVTAASNHLIKLIAALDLARRRTRNVMIIGGSRIAYYLASMLLQNGVAVKIIERNASRCRELADSLPKAMVIEGDGNRQSLLLEEGLKEMDALVTLTDLDEQNIFLSLYGAHIGVPKNITKVNQTEYSDVIHAMGVESVISPKMLTATEIVRYVRAMAETVGGSVITMHEMVGGKVQALEFLASEKTRYLGKTLLETPVRKNILVACIMRKNRPLIPKGDDCIQKDDTVIVVATGDRAIVDLNDIFE